MERSNKVSQAMPGFRVCTLTRCKIEDFSLLLMMLIGDLAKFSSSRVVGQYVCRQSRGNDTGRYQRENGTTVIR